MAPSLNVVVNGIEFDNPFLLGSGPPGTNARVIMKSFELGWGGNVCKTISLDHSKVINTNPRYAKLRDPDDDKKVIGFENIELISDRPFDTWLEEFREIKKRWPNKVLIASIMEEYRKEAWVEIVERVQETGVDGFEMNLSCPHGLPERRMGAAMGSNPEIVGEVVGWVKSVSKIPVWAKMTPNVGDPTASPKAAVEAGVDGLAAINTILSVVGIDLDTLRPMPTVEGHSTPGGYSGMAARPIALRHVMEIAKALPNTPISGMGGIYSGSDAAQFVALGCHTVQVCTGAMLQGYKVIKKLTVELQAVLEKHGYDNLEQLRGAALPYFTTHSDLVERQREAKKDLALERDASTWQGEIDKETDSLTAN
ncbi:Dihydropyrimidine dehydrogenase [Enhygromyxa salina]|uniref:dihydrouracil dehydrogenase (NAD(+)) n=1 Tax=Enhygromyxa salina TaxID=215803 RepID=A0A0C2CWZ1_9BACT|nr:NAD-dependent dihydropyrimidine dehydrogenase subunit PreA [Enhygromyxa salina]KIG15551.1 Dihydropyrimidine dehydrogenase [Enhygromyxa salina]